MAEPLPEFCIHREPIPGSLGRTDVERAQPGMRVVYRREHCKPEVGVIQRVTARMAFVLYLGDLTAKGTNLDDLWLWGGVDG